MVVGGEEERGADVQESKTHEYGYADFPSPRHLQLDNDGDRVDGEDEVIEGGVGCSYITQKSAQRSPSKSHP